MEYGVLDYKCVNGRFNIGDYVQSLAALNQIPSCTRYINREELNSYTGPKIKIILNGWFMHQPLNWPPSSNILPLFVSFHINRPFIKTMLTQRGVEYLKRHEPIGCRDHYTAEILNDRNISAYYTGCLTTTLPPRNNTESSCPNVLFVDALHAVARFQDYFSMPIRSIASHLLSGNILRSINKEKVKRRLINSLEDNFGTKVTCLENSIACGNLSTSDKFDAAKHYLERLSHASLVVTSRIHCALPCLAMNVPVVFVKYGQTSESNVQRFRGVIDHMNVLDIDGDCNKRGIYPQLVSIEDVMRNQIKSNPMTHIPLAKKLNQLCSDFLEYAPT